VRSAWLGGGGALTGALLRKRSALPWEGQGSMKRDPRRRTRTVTVGGAS
jgi:hypothetical protein